MSERSYPLQMWSPSGEVKMVKTAEEEAELRAQKGYSVCAPVDHEAESHKSKKKK